MPERTILRELEAACIFAGVTNVGLLCGALAIFVASGCAPPQGEEPPSPVPSEPPAPAVEVAPPREPPIAQAAIDDDCARCEPVTDCTVLARTSVTRATAPAMGLEVRDGEVVCDPEALGCDGALGRAGHVWRLELSESCGLGSDVFVTDRALYQRKPISVGGSGGSGWALDRTPVAASTLRFHGHGFFSAGDRVFCRYDEVAGAHATSFHAVGGGSCTCEARDDASFFVEVSIGPNSGSILRAPS